MKDNLRLFWSLFIMVFFFFSKINSGETTVFSNQLQKHVLVASCELEIES